MRNGLLAIAALTAALLPAACSAPPRAADGFDPRQAVADVAAFQAQPSQRTWAPLRAALLQNPTQHALTASLVEALVEQPVPARVFDAAAVDLATSDWPATVKWIRQYNVVARTDPSAHGRSVVAASARLAWLLFALRANYARDAVDLTSADLRDPAPFVGQAMNLTNVDFSGGLLDGGTWRGSNLLGATFTGATVAGVLRCDDCSFGSSKYPGELRLAGNQWVPAR